MNKTFLSICLAMMAVMDLHAENYTGTIVVNALGQTRTQTVTVTVTPTDNGLNTLALDVPVFGTMTMSDVAAATTGDVTVYSAERQVSTKLGTMRTVLFARTVGGMMAANVTLPDQGATMWFNTVGDYFQLPNSDMESWTGSNNEPDRWHSFKSATGFWASFSPATLGQSTDIHDGATGSYSAVITSKNAFGTIANGTMTNGRLNAGATSATDVSNHASSDESYGSDYYMPIHAKPDQFKVWLKYQQGATPVDTNRATVSVKTFDGSYYQEPQDKAYSNLSGGIAENDGLIAACDWTQFTFPITYDQYAENNAETRAIFVTFSTNKNPGKGSDNDQLYIDDMELVYLGAMTDLRYQGATIAGWDPAVTAYSMELTGAPTLEDFTASVEGASAVVTKSMEQNADGSYRIAISVVSADLQNGACYIITATVKAQGLKGDINGDGKIDVADVSIIINGALGKQELDLTIADMNDDGKIDVADVSIIINIALGKI